MSVGEQILAKNLVITASAGSGKTFQLGNRVIGLVAVREVDPERIVALTFTRKAAGEFADAVLTKLAGAALEEDAAGRLWRDLGGEFPVEPVLEKVVRSLPRMQFGTMDGFFTRVVRGFQYELGLSGGAFELIEGPRLASALAGILSDVLGGALAAEEGGGVPARLPPGHLGQGGPGRAEGGAGVHERLARDLEGRGADGGLGRDRGFRRAARGGGLGAGEGRPDRGPARGGRQRGGGETARPVRRAHRRQRETREAGGLV